MLRCGTIDIGNTRVKLRFTSFNTEDQSFQPATLSVHPKEEFSLELLKKWVEEHEIKYIACAASGHISVEVNNWFTKHNVLLLSHKSNMPIKIAYETPETLGKDRMAVAIAANSMYPNEGNLVIDLGTCITYDWVDPKGVFLGGNISPGIEMRLEAMHEKTASLPKAELSYSVDLVGRNTISALQHLSLIHI